MGKGCCVRSSAVLLFHNQVALISEMVSKLLTRELLELWSPKGVRTRQEENCRVI
jgi:hypothetical protein